MKNKKTLSIIIIFLSAFFFSCEKNIIPPFPTSNNIDSKDEFPDCYVATAMEISCNATDNRPLKHGDTIQYAEFIINLSFSGELISQGSMGSSNNYLELFSYYVNLVKKVEVVTDKNYINNTNNITNNINLLKYSEGNEVIKAFKTLADNQLGYSPIKLLLNTAPSNPDYYSFTVEITDIYDNFFVATTDSIFIEN